VLCLSGAVAAPLLGVGMAAADGRASGRLPLITQSTQPPGLPKG